MNYVIWGGAALSFLGLIGIGYSMLAVARARRAGLDDEALRARIAQLIPVNLGALFVSVIGLMAVIVGIILA